TVQNTQRTFYLNGEVHVAGGVDDVDPMPVLLGLGGIAQQFRVAPVAGGRSRSDGNTTLLLLRHPVHGSRAIVRFTDLVVNTSVIQDTLGGGGLAGVDVRHNADVSGHFQRNVSWHINLLYIQGGSITVMGESLVGL